MLDRSIAAPELVPIHLFAEANALDCIGSEDIETGNKYRKIGYRLALIMHGRARSTANEPTDTKRKPKILYLQLPT